MIDKQKSWIKTLKGNIVFNIFDKKNKKIVEQNNTISLSKQNFDFNKSLAIFKSNNIKKILNSKKDKKTIFEQNFEKQIKKEIKEKNITLEKVINNIKNEPKNVYSYMNMRNYLRVNPKEILDIAEQFNQFDDYQQMKIIGFVSTIDSPYAQKGLLNILNNPNTTHINKLRSIIGVGFTKHPTDETEDNILKFIDNNLKDDEKKELSNSALLAIGTFSKIDSHNGEDLENEIISFYQNGKYSSDKITALRAMQNSNPNHFIPQILESLKSDSYRERLVAIKTLLETGNKKQIKDVLNNHLKTEKTKKR